MMRFLFARTQNRFDQLAIIVIIMTTMIQGPAPGMLIAVGTAIISVLFQNRVEREMRQGEK